MITLLKDRYRLGLALATCFLVGVLYSMYVIYSLPQALNLSDVSALTQVYIAVGTTMLLGALTIYIALMHRNEVVVYRDRQQQERSNEAQNQAKNESTVSIQPVAEALSRGGDEKTILQNALNAVCKQLEAGQGAFYRTTGQDGRRMVELKAGYALNIAESTVIAYEFGEGLVGQCAASGKALYIDEVPDGYIKIISGLGMASPRYLLIVPVVHQGNVAGIIEIASFSELKEEHRKFADEAAKLIGQKLA